MMGNIFGRRDQSVRRTARPRPGRLALERLEDRCLLAAKLTNGIWDIQGSLTAANRVEIDRDPGNAAYLRAFVNGALEGRELASKVDQIRVVTGTGNDLIRIAETILAPANITTGAGKDTVFSGSGDDVINGGAGSDILWGRNGSDLLIGGDDRDFLYGGFGNDTLLGEAGNDYLVGNGTVESQLNFFQTDNDRLDGGAGSNTLIGNPNEDTLLNGTTPAAPTRFGSEANLRTSLIEEGVNRYQTLFGTQYAVYGWWGPFPIDILFTTSMTDGSATPGSGNYSTTTVQEQGVDEADIVKTDGQYIYRVLPSQPYYYSTSHPDRSLVIFNTSAPNELAILSRTTLEGSPIALFLHGNSVTVFSSICHPPVPIGQGDAPPPTGGTGGPGGGAALDIAIFPWFRPPQRQVPPQVKVTTFDVTDRTAPRVVQETYLDGTYNGSRLIEDRMYVAVQTDTRLFLEPRVNQVGSQYFYETEAEYRARLKSAPLSELVPSFRTRVPDGSGGTIEQSGPISAPADFFGGGTGQESTFASVLQFDVTGAVPGPVDSVTFETPASSFDTIVYASLDNFYVASQGYVSGAGGGYVTSLYRVQLGEGGLELTGSGQVPGQVRTQGPSDSTLSQFSMDEEGPYFRIATTSGGWPNFTNNVYVLASEEGVLYIAGNVEDLSYIDPVTGQEILSTGERIYTARFVGERGYVVTFRQIDPLFTLDLSDPLAPRVAGALEIPGFSRFLLPIGDTLLLAVGRDATVTGFQQGLQVSLFDVSNLSNPTLLHRYSLQLDEWTWSASAAEFDHRAVSYFAESGILALPVSGTRRVPNPSGPGFIYRQEYNLVVLRVDETSGFTLIGEVVHATPNDQVLRSIRIGDTLYSLGQQTIQAQFLLDPSIVIAMLTHYQADEPLPFCGPFIFDIILFG